ncbi:MAG TPA: hypothetical protein VF690_11950 [Hymenobacter sp.]|jgi:hypothetical protein
MPAIAEPEREVARLPPFWWVALLSMAVTVGINLALFSFYTGKLDGRVSNLESRVTVLETEKARREAREQEKVYEYEKMKARKYAELEDQIYRLKNTK